MVSSETEFTPSAEVIGAEPPAEALAPDEVWTAADSRYWTVALLILCVGIGLRQLWLDVFPFHPDEAIHAWFPLNFLGYNYDPVYHGPLLYHLQAAVYAVLGPYDYTARLMPSLLGIGLLAVLIGPARRWLGDRAALWCLALVAISPVITTYQRRLLHDSLVMLLTLGAVLCFQQARENASDTPAGRNARIGLVVLLALFVSTKANAFFIIAMLAAFWLAVKINSWLRAKMPDDTSLWRFRNLLAEWLLPAVSLIFAVLCIVVIIRLRAIAPVNFVVMLVPFALLLIAAVWLMARDELRKIGAYRVLLWNWLPAVMLAFVAIASVLAVRDPAEWKPIIEQAYSWTCLLCTAVVWLWLVAGPTAIPILPEEENAESETDEAVEAESTPMQSTPAAVAPNLYAHDFPKPARRDIKTPALAGWAGLLVFAFLFGHGFLWYQAPLRLVQQTAEWRVSTSASLQAIGSTAWQPIDRVLHGDLGSVREGARHVITDHIAPDGAKPGPAALVNAPDWYDIGHAIPKMIAYWGKQQKEPRLPGRHDYYMVLMLLYELPIVIAGLFGLVYASRNRTPFTDLLLWWMFTSFTIYALANEKVPWLLTHIMLPWALLAGVWLSQLRFTQPAKRAAFAVACVLGAIYLGRGVSATNFERAVDHHEPMFYAQTSENYRDALFDAMRRTQKNNVLIWMHNDLQWPTVWYTREGAPLRNESPVTFTADPGDVPLRMVISNKDVWDKTERFRNWTSRETNFYIWPRASWPALRPPVWTKFWWTRQASADNGVLAPPGESPGPALAIIGVPPCPDQPCE